MAEEAGAGAQNIEQQYRVREVRHIAWQTWIALAAVLVPSVLAFLAFRDQQAVNRAQQAITREQQEREERRFAYRVGWWVEYDGGAILHLQNRSPAPLAGVNVTGQARAQLVNIKLGGVPPCTAVQMGFRGREIQTLVGIEDPALGIFGVSFSDPIGRWQSHGLGDLKAIDARGLSLDAQTGKAFVSDDNDTSRPTVELPITYEPVSDCGEAS